jgi:hypothetical protein
MRETAVRLVMAGVLTVILGMFLILGATDWVYWAGVALMPVGAGVIGLGLCWPAPQCRCETCRRNSWNG